jgi:hypothetical protein
MEVHYVCGDDGKAYYAKGFVPFDKFMAAVKAEEYDDAPILICKPEHCWLRTCRDFQEERTVFVEAAPGSRGAFRVTWVQDE